MERPLRRQLTGGLHVFPHRTQTARRLVHHPGRSGGYAGRNVRARTRATVPPGRRTAPGSCRSERGLHLAQTHPRTPARHHRPAPARSQPHVGRRVARRDHRARTRDHRRRGRASRRARPRTAVQRGARRGHRPRTARDPARRRVGERDHGQSLRPDLRRTWRPHRAAPHHLHQRPRGARRHRAHRRAARPPHRRILADGRCPAARRLAGQCDHPAARPQGPDAHHPQVRASGARGHGPRPHGFALARDGRIPAHLRRAAAQRRGLRRHRLGQDHLPQPAVELHPRRRTHHHHRGRRRAAPAPQPPGQPGGAPVQPGRARRDQHPRPRAQRVAHAPRPHRGGRMPRRRGARHAAGDEHRPRGLDDDPAREQPARCARPPRDARPDGRHGSPAGRDPRADRQRGGHHRPADPLRLRRAPAHQHHRAHRHGGRTHPAAGTLPLRAPQRRFPTADPSGGHFTGCDAVPGFYDELRRQGVALDLHLFDRKRS